MSLYGGQGYGFFLQRALFYDLKSRNAILERLEGLGYQLLIWYGIAF